jgi:hypothetical protein
MSTEKFIISYDHKVRFKQIKFKISQLQEELFKIKRLQLEDPKKINFLSELLTSESRVELQIKKFDALKQQRLIIEAELKINFEDSKLYESFEPEPDSDLAKIQSDIEECEKQGGATAGVRIIELMQLAREKYHELKYAKYNAFKNQLFLEKTKNIDIQISTLALFINITGLRNSIATHKNMLHFTLHNYKTAYRHEFKRRVEIKRVISARKIKHLIHFTRLENVVGIFNHGLLSRAECQKLNLGSVNSDEFRLDSLETRTCLSISFPNYKMLYSKTNALTSPEYCLLFIRPRVLYKNHCLFSPGNAASASFKDAALGGGWNGIALEKMFNEIYDIRSRSGIPDSYPTDPQAEVLLEGRILPCEIFAIHVRTSSLEEKLVGELKWTPDIMNKTWGDAKFFNYREDVRYW